MPSITFNSQNSHASLALKEAKSNSSSSRSNTSSSKTSIRCYDNEED